MELEPASIDQVQLGADGKFITIENDVGGIVEQIKQVNKDLQVRFSDVGNYFVVYYESPVTHKQTLLTTAKELDGRLVNRVRLVTSGHYNYLEELDKIDSAAEAEKDAKIKEQVQELGERLAHAMRQDLGVWKDSARTKKSWGKGLVGY